MVKDTMTRVQITLSKTQAEWLEKTCKKARISKSKYISWILSKKAEELLKILKLNTHFGNYTDEEIQRLMQVNWIEEN